MPKVIAELAITNEALVKRGYDDFEENPAWSRRQIAINLGDWFEFLGLSRSYTHGRETTTPVFIEWDSGNPSHACGYWQVEIEVTKGLYDLIDRASKSED